MLSAGKITFEHDVFKKMFAVRPVQSICSKQFSCRSGRRTDKETDFINAGYRMMAKKLMFMP